MAGASDSVEQGASPNELHDPLIRREVKKAKVWFGGAILIALVVLLIQPLTVIFAGLILGVMLDGGVRLLGRALPIGRGRILREGTAVAILSLGTRLADSLRAADELAARGLSTTVADARFAKPFDTALVEQLARHHGVLIIIEEGSVGGFGAAVMQHLALRGLLDGGVRVRPMTLPDRYIDHSTPAAQMIEAGLSAKDIVRTAMDALGRDAAQPPRIVPVR